MLQSLSALFLSDSARGLRFRCGVVLFVAIIAAGSIPGARAEIGVVASGIFLHFAAYSCITILLYTGTEGTRKARLLRAVLAVAIMGAIDELVQSVLPYRNGTVMDWTIDCTAAIVTGSVLYLLLPERAGNKPE